MYDQAVIPDEAAFNRALGARIKEARKQSGLTQDRLARRLQLGRTAIVMIERGDQRVPAHLVVNLAEALGVGVAALLAVEEITHQRSARVPNVGSPAVNAWVRGALDGGPDAVQGG